jgi:hypothetical protein
MRSDICNIRLTYGPCDASEQEALGRASSKRDLCESRTLQLFAEFRSYFKGSDGWAQGHAAAFRAPTFLPIGEDAKKKDDPKTVACTGAPLVAEASSRK